MSMPTGVFALTRTDISASGEGTKGIASSQSATFGGSTFINYLTLPFPLIIGLIPVGRVRVGIFAQIGAEVEFIKALYASDPNLPEKPERAILDISLGMGDEGDISSFKGRLSGRAYLLGGIKIEKDGLSPDSPVTLSPLITFGGHVQSGGPSNSIKIVIANGIS